MRLRSWGILEESTKSNLKTHTTHNEMTIQIRVHGTFLRGRQ